MFCSKKNNQWLLTKYLNASSAKKFSKARKLTSGEVFSSRLRRLEKNSSPTWYPESCVYEHYPSSAVSEVSNVHLLLRKHLSAIIFFRHQTKYLWSLAHIHQKQMGRSLGLFQKVCESLWTVAMSVNGSNSLSNFKAFYTNKIKLLGSFGKSANLTKKERLLYFCKLATVSRKLAASQWPLGRDSPEVKTQYRYRSKDPYPTNHSLWSNKNFAGYVHSGMYFLAKNFANLEDVRFSTYDKPTFTTPTRWRYLQLLQNNKLALCWRYEDVTLAKDQLRANFVIYRQRDIPLVDPLKYKLWNGISFGPVKKVLGKVRKPILKKVTNVAYRGVIRSIKIFKNLEKKLSRYDGVCFSGTPLKLLPQTHYVILVSFFTTKVTGVRKFSSLTVVQRRKWQFSRRMSKCFRRCTGQSHNLVALPQHRVRQTQDPRLAIKRLYKHSCEYPSHKPFSWLTGYNKVHHFEYAKRKSFFFRDSRGVQKGFNMETWYSKQVCRHQIALDKILPTLVYLTRKLAFYEVAKKRVMRVFQSHWVLLDAYALNKGLAQWVPKAEYSYYYQYLTNSLGTVAKLGRWLEQCTTGWVSRKSASRMYVRRKAQHLSLIQEHSLGFTVNSLTCDKRSINLSTQARLFYFIERWVSAHKQLTRLVSEGAQPYYRTKGYWKKPIKYSRFLGKSISALTVAEASLSAAEVSLAKGKISAKIANSAHLQNKADLKEKRALVLDWKFSKEEYRRFGNRERYKITSSVNRIIQYLKWVTETNMKRMLFLQDVGNDSNTKLTTNKPNVISVASIQNRAKEDSLKVDFYIKKRKELLKDLSKRVKKFVQAREKDYLEDLELITQRYTKRRKAIKQKIRAQRHYHKWVASTTQQFNTYKARVQGLKKK